MIQYPLRVPDEKIRQKLRELIDASNAAASQLPVLSNQIQILNAKTTFVAGTGISIAGGSTKITNVGVTSLVAGTGVTVSGSTGSVTITNGGVTSLIASSGVSVSAATGDITLTNTGVLSLTAGTGISVSASTGNITITNIGVTAVAAGTGISVSASTGSVTITNIGVTSITGTSNQVIASASTGAVTLSTPQNIHTGASPQFAGLVLTGLATKYNNVTTAGLGVAAIYGQGRATAQNGANSSVAAYTPAADGSFIISMNILITAFTAGTVSGVVTYTDEGGTGRSLTMNFSSITGVLGTTVGAAGAFEGVPLHIRAKGTNAITVTTTVSVFTGVYNVEGIIMQISV